ncbi:Antibiotic biosynthesis monooxygenase [Macrophomina phaseolina MS6]|uniref:Antibiotic biosynthesis monooxygenase n=2 Tax=Macrophomina phaseolina TaxID=35725 RepID=K2RG48_MACPH|nr:Antibiotic biosynthesis monooxygenase [Macrophomina phaseolina MS6]KAH7043313.1 hypothetical protein B0J12DRAFT_787803 [Macrophomina phaseolina]
MASFTVSTVYRPTPGKVQETEQLVAECVKASERYTVNYEIIKDSNIDQPAVVVVQTFKDPRALREHFSTPTYRNAWQSLISGGLLAGPPQVFTAYPQSLIRSRRRSTAAGFDAEF